MFSMLGSTNIIFLHISVPGHIFLVCLDVLNKLLVYFQHFDSLFLVRLEVLKTGYAPKIIFVYFRILSSRFLVCLEVLNFFRVHFRNLDSRFFSTLGSTKTKKV